MMSWRLAATVIMAAAGAVSCGSVRHSATAPAAPSPRGAGSAMGFAPAARKVHCLSPERQPVGVPLPTGFTAVAAIRCIQADQAVPGRGLWQFELRQVADNGLARLTGALRRPSVTAPPNTACAEPEISVPPFMLLGRDGRMIYPKLPTGKCGNPQPQVLTAVRGLRFVTVSARRGAQIETQAGFGSGCPAGWKDVIGILDSLSNGKSQRPSVGGPVFSSRPPWLRVCVYRDRPGPLDTYLVGGGRVSGAAETALLRGIAAGGTPATCPRPHTMFAVLLPPGTGGLAAYVEIGGCHRVLRPGNRVGQATSAALAILNRVRRG
jgi:hypothetical protein